MKRRAYDSEIYLMPVCSHTGIAHRGWLL